MYKIAEPQSAARAADTQASDHAQIISNEGLALPSLDYHPYNMHCQIMVPGPYHAVADNGVQYVVPACARGKDCVGHSPNMRNPGLCLRQMPPAPTAENFLRERQFGIVSCKNEPCVLCARKEDSEAIREFVLGGMEDYTMLSQISRVTTDPRDRGDGSYHADNCFDPKEISGLAAPLVMFDINDCFWTQDPSGAWYVDQTATIKPKRK
jgi:hypothetical protein